MTQFPKETSPQLPAEPAPELASPMESAEISDAAPRARSFSMAGKLAGVIVVGLAVYSLLVLVGQRLTHPDWFPMPLPTRLIHLLAFIVVAPPLIWCVGLLLQPLIGTVTALSDGIRSFHDRDFSVRIATRQQNELGDLVRLYNRVSETLQQERAQIRQRELLLQGALDQSPIAIVLVNPLDRVVYANAEARRLLLGVGTLQGRLFSEVLQGCPGELRQVLDSGADGIFSVDTDGEAETYHLARRRFLLNQQRHTLFLLRRMTAELARQEVEIWKKVIRIISHELNNSLAPISSLAHSGRLIAAETDQAERLDAIYDAIRDRVEHLSQFLEGYAKFARLPAPNQERVEWPEWLATLREGYPFQLEGQVPSVAGYFDPAQLQQVMINLLKNAVEASPDSSEIAVRIDALPDGASRVQVLDRGRGMTEDVMRQSLLPFYSTKQSGTGLGLPLCREIVEAHGGSLRIQSRKGGGIAVSFWLPRPTLAS